MITFSINKIAAVFCILSSFNGLTNNYDSAQLRIQGNVFPAKILDFEYIQRCHASNYKINQVAFLDTSNIICLDESGCIYSYNLEDNTVLKISNIPSNSTWNIIVVDSDSFIVLGFEDVIEPSPAYDVFYFKKDGTLIWYIDDLEGYEPNYFMENLYFIGSGEDRDMELYKINNDSIAEHVITYDIDASYFHWLVPAGDNLLLIGPQIGPFIIDQSDNYRMRQWSSNYNDGGFRFILSNEEDLILNRSPHELTLLNSETNQVQNIDFKEQLSLPDRLNVLAFSYCGSVEELYILYGDHLLRYRNESFELLSSQMRDILQDERGLIYSDPTMNHYYIFTTNAIVIGQDENYERILIEERSSDFAFDYGFNQFIFGTPNGDIIVYEVVKSN